MPTYGPARPTLKWWIFWLRRARKQPDNIDKDVSRHAELIEVALPRKQIIAAVVELLRRVPHDFFCGSCAPLNSIQPLVGELTEQVTQAVGLGHGAADMPHVYIT